jgi:M-phase inducer tyrosine phosphatase
MYRWLRGMDRAANIENYPALTYPEIYILDGGYSTFYQMFPGMCDPSSYVSMDAPEYK